VLVANAYGPDGGRNAPATEAARIHGDYLLQHFHVTADGRELSGRLVPSASTSESNRFFYDFDYPLAGSAKVFRFSEDVLNEFEFAPGNRWEASYIVEITDGVSRREGLLLTSREPLEYTRDAAAAAAPAVQLDRWEVFLAYCRHGLLHI
jgi:hypothetical protein